VRSTLKSAILRRFATQFDCAAAARIGYSRLSLIVRGRVTPTQAEAQRLAEALGIELAAVLELDPRPARRADAPQTLGVDLSPRPRA